MIDSGSEALQRTLAAEHAAVYLYGVLGAQTSQSATPELYAAMASAYAVHRQRRDLLAGWLRDDGSVPVAAAPTYRIPGALDSPAAVTARALAAERTAQDVYAALVAQTVTDRRRWAAGALIDASVRALGFGGVPEPLPAWE